jgi:hypothetical protein
MQMTEALALLQHQPGKEWCQQVASRLRSQMADVSAVQLMALVGALSDVGAGSRQSIMERLQLEL